MYIHFSIVYYPIYKAASLNVIKYSIIAIGEPKKKKKKSRLMTYKFNGSRTLSSNNISRDGL